jgi:nitroreductase
MEPDKLLPEIANHRKSTYPINPIFLNRWSKRAISPEPLSDEELFPLLEAARWAPSAYNDQFWRFVIGRGENKEKFVSFLSEFNRRWAAASPVLVLVTARTTLSKNGAPAPSSEFDAGAASENIALEGARRGLVVHPLTGFDKEAAGKELGVPADHAVLALLAIGKPGRKEDLPEDLRERETPSGRLPLSEIVFEGRFGAKADVREKA